MIRPSRFFPNPETAADNSFQQTGLGQDEAELTENARREFDRAVEQLRGHGVTVHVMDDTASPEKPDAVFPNNWISTHHDGRIALFPMLSPARRLERRPDVIEELRRHYRVGEVVDYTAFEKSQQYLEGTGSLVLDHLNRGAYVSLSQRSHPAPLQRFCADFNFEPICFGSADAEGSTIYHTNVMMCLATHFALLGADCIADEMERETVRRHLAQSGRTVVELTQAQIAEFAGNAIELQNEREKLLVLSARGRASLTSEQIQAIEQHARIIPLQLPTIELAGGSARCMLATIHLPPR